MSLLTRCPACDTLYRVVPDQLRISEGWVKCGQCGDIFDASKQLIEAASDVESLSEEMQTDALTVDPLPSFQAPTSSLESEAEAVAEVQASSSGNDVVLVDVPQEFVDMVTTPDDSVQLAVVGSSPVTTPESDLKADSYVSSDLVHAECQEPSPLQATSQPSEAEDPPQVAFLTQGSTQNIWQKPVVRFVLWLLMGILAVALLGQWVFVERNQLVAQHPEFKPVLQTFCDLARCKIQPLKRIEFMSVDSVGFLQLDKETYRLSFVVKNASPWPLALPSVELVLTDAQDQPVYRRVFSVQELGSTETVIAANSEWSTSVALHVATPVSHGRVLGYRLLIFYP